MRRLRACIVVAALLASFAIAARPAAADPANNPNAIEFSVTCPDAQFEATVIGAVGFVHGEPVLAIRQAPDQGGLDLVECSGTSEQTGTVTLFLQFVERG
jgi:hypothetical protein